MKKSGIKNTKFKGAKTPSLKNIKGDSRRQDYNAIRYESSKVKSVDDVKSFYDSMVASDQKLKSFVDAVKKGGNQLYLVGGSVRDIFMGRKPKDMDFVTNIPPEGIGSIIEKLGAKNLEVGKKFGTNVLVGDKDTYDIVPFRKDEYGDDDPHRPKSVEFVKTVDEDLSRRDFTINAMAYDVFNNKLIDNFGGMDDLKAGVIRSVGDAKQRFQEDPVRIFRAFRFASTLGFTIDKPIMDVIPEFVNNKKANSLSRERIVVELEKTLMSENPDVGIKAMVDTGINKIKMRDNKGESVDFLPEISHLKDLEQNDEYHKFDALKHTLEVVKNAPRDVDSRYAALLHDAGKGLSHIRTMKNGKPQDIGHQEESSIVTKNVLKRFGVNQTRIRDVDFMVANHMKLLTDTSPKHMNRYLNSLKLGFNNKADFRTAVSRLMDLRTADVSAGLKLEGGAAKIGYMKEALLKHIDSTAMFASDLKITGNDVASILGVKGKEIGEVLKSYVQRVQDGSVKNDRESLIVALEKKRDRQLEKNAVKESIISLKIKKVEDSITEDLSILSTYKLLKNLCKLIIETDKYTNDEIELVNAYRNGDFKQITTALKSFNIKVLEKLQHTNDVKPVEFLTNMDNIINKAKITSDAYVYKILDSNMFPNIDELLLNMRFKDCSYFTAAITYKKLETYIKNQFDGALLKIKVPKNINGVFIENADLECSDIILPRNCVFEIVDVSDEIIYNNIIKIVTAEIINIASI